MTRAVLDFFTSGKLLKEPNVIVLTLIPPKVTCPNSVMEFRPIACCNTLYKCITKMLCNRLGKILPDIISKNQGAFVQERFIIVRNVMVYQELVRHHSRNNVKSSCNMKLDMKKA